MHGRREPRLASGAVAQVLLANGRCVPCIITSTRLDLDAVLEGVRALETDVTLLRTWGACPACGKKNRAVLSIR